jgi:hypothetical protein
MDHLAKRYWQQLFYSPHTPLHTPPQHHIHGEGWSIWNGNNKIICPRRNNLYSVIQNPISTMYWVRHKRITQADIPKIDWEACKLNMKSLRQNERRWVTKHSSEECGVGTTLVHWKYQDDARCPRCNQNEDTEHVIKCTDQEATNIWNEHLTGIEQYLFSTDTDPSIIRCIVTGLHSWRSNSAVTEYDVSDTKQTYNSQSEIGWHNFLQGLPSKRWKIAQQRYYNSIQSPASSKKWMTNLLNLFIKLGRALWEHRNEVKHRTKRPRHNAEEERTNEEIILEYHKGTRDLPIGEHHFFRCTLATLLQKPFPYRKSWLANLTTARQRQARKRSHDNDLVLLSRKRSKLLQYFQTNRPS